MSNGEGAQDQTGGRPAHEENGLVPMVVKRSAAGERAMDIYSTLLDERVILLTGPIDDELSKDIVAQLLYLDASGNGKPIYMYINSPGGSVTSGNSIIDVMAYVDSPIETINVGMCASMAAAILSCGDKRSGMPSSRTMIHQASGGAQGKADDVSVTTEQLALANVRVTQVIAANTGHTVEDATADMELDHYMDAGEALDYGIIDTIITPSANRPQKRAPVPTTISGIDAQATRRSPDHISPNVKRVQEMKAAEGTKGKGRGSAHQGIT